MKLKTPAALAAALTAAALGAGPAEAAFPGANGRIVFDRLVGDQPDLFTIQPDGSGERSIRSTRRFEEQATWSPDGRRIAFAVSPPAGFPTEVWTMDAEGGDARRVTNLRTFTGAPSWAPSGDRLTLFTTRDFPLPGEDEPPPPAEIYTMGVDGGSLSRLTRDRRIQTDPVFSPDGSAIAYDQWREVPGQPGVFDMALYLRDADGSNPRPLTRLSSARDTFNASWSPDGRFLVFQVVRPRPGQKSGERQSDLSIIAADGTGERRLTFSNALEQQPVWSPDGQRIAFVSDQHRPGGRPENAGPRFELYTMAVDGTDVTRLTHNRVPEGSPNWQPLP